MCSARYRCAMMLLASVGAVTRSSTENVQTPCMFDSMMAEHRAWSIRRSGRLGKELDAAWPLQHPSKSAVATSSRAQADKWSHEPL